MRKEKILLLNTEIGNIQSVANVLEYIGADFFISDRPEDLSLASKIIFPGVGTYGNAMEKLATKGFRELLRKALLEDKKLYLGICVGMQVLADIGHEFGQHQGLSIIPGEVKRIDVGSENVRLPHIGWNDVEFTKNSPLFKNIHQGASFYFLHSYHFIPKDPSHISCAVSYGTSVVAAVEYNNVFGVQFHPEKSQEAGIKLLKNFVEL